MLLRWNVKGNVPPVQRLIAFPDSTKTSWDEKNHKLISDNYIFAWNLHFFYTLFKSDSIFQPNKQKDKQSAASSVWYQNNTRKWFVTVKFHRSQKPPIRIVNVRLSENRQTNWASTNNDFLTGVNRTLKVLKPTWKRRNYGHKLPCLILHLF